MQVTRFIRSSFMRIAVAAVAIWFVGPTRAATFAVGAAAPTGSFALGDEALLAPLADAFMFSSGAGAGAGAAFESSSFGTTGHVGRSATFDVNILEDLPSRDYSSVFGDSATFFDPSLPIGSSHAASIDIAATSPVSEPPASALLLTGAVLLAWHLYRRRVER